MFASRITSEVQLGEERVVIRKLSAFTLDKARDARQATQARSLRNYGGEILKAIRSENLDKVAEEAGVKAEPSADVKAAAKAARYAEFDQELTLNAGVVSWTVADRKVNPESIADLDEKSAKVLFEAIIDLSAPVSAATEEKG